MPTKPGSPPSTQAAPSTRPAPAARRATSPAPTTATPPTSDARKTPPKADAPPDKKADAKKAAKANKADGDAGDDIQREYARDFIKNYWSRGPLVAFFLIFVAGFLVSLTPCVYPMIPITIAVIGATSAGEHHGRWHSFVLAFLYVVGMAIPYSALGGIVAYIGKQPFLLGGLFNSPYFLGFLVTLFGLMAISMFGAFDLALPTSWQTKMSMFQGKGYLGIIGLGIIGALLATPCSGPVIVGLLAFVAQSGDVTKGIVIPAVFTFGIGVPFLVLGGGVVQALPRSGKWMTEVKKVFGVILLVASLYYGYLLALRLVPHNMHYFTLGLSVLLLFLGISAGAFRGYALGLSLWERLKQTVGLIALVVGLYLLVVLLLWKGFLLPPWSQLARQPAGKATQSATGGAAGPKAGPRDECLPPPHHPADKPYWLTSEKKGVACAKKLNRPMIIDFWAVWCTSCKQLEKKSFNTRAVAKESRRFIMVKYEYKESSPEDERLRKKYQIRGLPWVRFVSAEGKVLRKPRIVGFVKASKLLNMMRQVR